MPRGTGFAVMEIIWWMLVAAAIGFAIGWLIRRWIRDSRHSEEITALRAEQHKLRSGVDRQTAGLRTKAEKAEADLKLRTADVDRLAIQLNDRNDRISSLEERLSKARGAAAKLEAKVEDRESTIAALRKETGREDRQLEGLRKDLDKANGIVGTLRKDADGYKNTIDSLRNDLDNERRKQGELKSELEAATAQAETAAAALTKASAIAETLQARLDELEASGAGGDTSGETARLEAELAKARQELTTTTTRLASLEEEHAACPTNIEVTITTSESDVLPAKDLAVARVAEIAARTRGDEPVVEDDLKKIHGVGPKLEKLLKSMDITSFKQVANFTKEDIQYVTAALDAFPGRIERDDWMTSASEQHAAKYGVPV